MSLRRPIISVVGARPHFVKAFPLFEQMAPLRDRHIIVHTGQHYDENMSALFFDQFGMPKPDINLEIGSGTHAQQTCGVMLGIEKLVLDMRPEAVIVFGDTNSTLGAALAASKYYFPVVHIEAGVRCFNWRMPEEINRTLIDHASDYLICPSETSLRNLEQEGIVDGVMNIGDVMYDTFNRFKEVASRSSGLLPALKLKPREYVLATLHREATTDDPEKLVGILNALGSAGDAVVLPAHPRTRKLLERAGYEPAKNSTLNLIAPVGYIEMLHLILNARKIVTDSGGVQKEAYWAGVPCITMMSETTWVETVSAGWNTLIGLDVQKLRNALVAPSPVLPRPDVYGLPGASERIVKSMGWLG